jgi:peroxiredoxin
VAATPSTMLPLGTPLPDFQLTNAIDGATVRSKDEGPGRPLLLMFICNHCPYVIHVRQELVRLAHSWMDRGLRVLAINSNSLTLHPEDGPGPMRTLATQEGWRFPFLFDASQSVAKAFRAACTPDFFLFDAAGKLAYRGQFDDSRPSKATAVTGKDLSEAVEAVLGGKAPNPNQKASVGCNIKWDDGNAPEYFR